MPQFSKRNLTLLIISSVEHDVNHLTATLKNLFTTIEVARSLADGQEQVAAKRIDAVLLDLTLTNGQGLTPIRVMRTRYPYLPIIVMTDGDVAADEAMACGACDFIRKSDMSPHVVFNSVILSVARRETFRKMVEVEAATLPLSQAIEAGKKLQESRG